MNYFRHKHVLITGASSGIGREMALQLAAAGASLYLAARRMEQLEEVKKACNNTVCQLFYLDLENSESIVQLVQQLQQQQVQLDMVVHNAGISQRSLAVETPVEVDRRIMEINFFGPVQLTKQVLPLLAPGAHQAVVSSMVGLMGFPLRSAYAASKHALHGFFESMQVENPDMKISIICPGRIQTGISRNALTAAGTPHNHSDSGQANGMPVEKCVKQILRAIEKNKKLTLVGGKELLLLRIKKYFPPLYYKIARNIDPT